MTSVTDYFIDNSTDYMYGETSCTNSATVNFQMIAKSLSKIDIKSKTIFDLVIGRLVGHNISNRIFPCRSSSLHRSSCFSSVDHSNMHNVTNSVRFKKCLLEIPTDYVCPDERMVSGSMVVSCLARTKH
jgi:hypothetical protein